MTKQKTISGLSVAAIALVAAAVPAMAQGQTESIRRNATIGGTTVAQTVASNRDFSTVSKSRAITAEVEPAGSVARSEKPLVLAALQGQNNFATSSIQQLNFKDAAPVDPMAKKQFRADETDSNLTSHVTFVSSRGQKLPE